MALPVARPWAFIAVPWYCHGDMEMPWRVPYTCHGADMASDKGTLPWKYLARAWHCHGPGMDCHGAPEHVRKVTFLGGHSAASSIINVKLTKSLQPPPSHPIRQLSYFCFSTPGLLAPEPMPVCPITPREHLPPPPIKIYQVFNSWPRLAPTL